MKGWGHVGRERHMGHTGHGDTKNGERGCVQDKVQGWEGWGAQGEYRSQGQKGWGRVGHERHGRHMGHGDTKDGDMGDTWDTKDTGGIWVMGTQKMGNRGMCRTQGWGAWGDTGHRHTGQRDTKGGDMGDMKDTSHGDTKEGDMAHRSWEHKGQGHGDRGHGGHMGHGDTKKGERDV